MANKDPSKTEQATPKKISETRRKGNVLMSQDITSFALVLVGVSLMYIMVPMLVDGFRSLFMTLREIDCRSSWDSQMLYNGSVSFLQLCAFILAPVMTGLCLVALLIMRLQIGSYFSMEATKWKFDSLVNLKSGVKSLIPSKQNTIKLLITVGKVFIVGYFVYASIRNDWDELLSLPLKPLLGSAIWVVERCYIMVFKILIFYALIAAVDYITKRKKYYEDMMMSKQEIKDENKNAEGDPKIKARIRQKMRQLIYMRMITEVPKADMVVTNPTHVAVAIRYEHGSFAPKVVAKGLRKKAERIKSIARAHNIPMIEAPPLARSLYRNTKLGGFIPEEFYAAVASLLAKLHRSGKKRFNIL